MEEYQEAVVAIILFEMSCQCVGSRGKEVVDLGHGIVRAAFVDSRQG